ncbi:hypothetical protein GKQ77_01790 [Streptomyces sp. BG9H]|uniref:Uncharacterized protein n=1 Tax=Streptomyces anatolicus TaxID=2675858 RepID=A0ABS6YFV7_9ACTN|nr:hypothetical protein [Streptomyces anatolicus]MBW5420303.1 hypothetical protein [Streptomyces anatolicus]
MASAAPAVNSGGNSTASSTEDAVRQATLKHLLAKIQGGDASPQEINTLKHLYPEIAKTIDDPSRTEVSVKEAVITEDGKIVSPVTGKPLSAAEIAEIEPPADAKPSDPSEEVETPEETEVDPEGAAASASGTSSLRAAVSGGKWKMTHITHTHRSLLGDTIFKYHTYARFNYKGGKVRAWGKRYDRFTNEADVVDVEKDRYENRKSKVPASSATSMMKRKVKLCAVGTISCYATLYPWAKVQVFGTGRTKIAGSGA